MRFLRAPAAASCLISVAACGGGDLVLPDDPAPATITIVAGNGQTGLSGSTLSSALVVRVEDEQGTPVTGAKVTFTLGAANQGGDIAPDTALTASDGQATATWTLGAAEGRQTVSAATLGAVVSGAAVVSFTATATGSGGSDPSAEHSSIVASPASIAAGTGSSTIRVTVRDRQGAALAGALVTLAASGSGNTLTQPTGVTGTDGAVSGTLVSVVPGLKVVSAVVNGDLELVQTAEVTVTAIPGPARLEFRTPPAGAEEGEVLSPAVEVAIVDEQGAIVPLSGIEIDLDLIRENGAPSKYLEGDDTQPTVDGIAVFPDLEIDREGDGYRLRAAVSGVLDLDAAESPPFDVED